MKKILAIILMFVMFFGMFGTMTTNDSTIEKVEQSTVDFKDIPHTEVALPYGPLNP